MRRLLGHAKPCRTASFVESYTAKKMTYEVNILPGVFDGTKGNTVNDQLAYDTEENLLTRGLPAIKEDELNCFICHAGFVDYELFRHTTLTLRRARDLDAMLSKKALAWPDEHDVELITYRDL